MCIVVSQRHERCCVFSQLRLFNEMQSQFALPSSFAILTNGRSSYGKVFPVSIAGKLQRGSSLLESSQPKSTQYSTQYSAFFWEGLNGGVKMSVVG